MEICKHYKYVFFCKFQDHCKKEHLEGECNALCACKSKVCNKRHPKVCKRFSLEKFCKFWEECYYQHPLDKNYKVQKLSAKHKIEISNHKEEVKGLELEVNHLTTLTKQFLHKPGDVTKDKKQHK